MSLVTDLGVPLATAAIAAAAALFGARAGSRGEHRQWLRDQRLQAYAALLDAADAHAFEHAEQMLVRQASNRVALVGPERLKAAADALEEATGEVSDYLDDHPECENTRNPPPEWLTLLKAHGQAVGYFRSSARMVLIHGAEHPWLWPV